MEHMNKIVDMKTESINTYLMAPVNNTRRAIVINVGNNEKKNKSIS